MIYYTPAHRRTLKLFKTPFDNTLDPENRWVRMAEVVPWDRMASVFHLSMSKSRGRGSIDLRVVMGALLVKHLQGLSDEDTVLCIQENIYVQYFVGLPCFQKNPVFVPSLFVEIRKRLGHKGVAKLNEMMFQQAVELRAIKHRRKPSKRVKDNHQGEDGQAGGTRVKHKPSQAELFDIYPTEDAINQESLESVNPGQELQEEPEVENRGTLKLDATVAPQHIGYPVDTKLLNQAREGSEDLIDKLYTEAELWSTKPRTYRRSARKAYLAFAKNRRPSKKQIRKAKGQQLRYLRRNLHTLGTMLELLEKQGLKPSWSALDWRRFWVLQELFRQQDIMHRDGRRQIDGRIVSVSQPYVRPIKRGKAGKDTEFGAKINVSETEGFVRIDQISFDNFNEGIYLQQQVEGYRAFFGYYPEVVLADQIYMNRENRNYLKERNIRHTGKPLGRPAEISPQEKSRNRLEQNKRSEIEGKFGQGKSKYGLDNIKTRLANTSMAYIGLIFLAMNVVKLSKALFSLLFWRIYTILQHVWDDQFLLQYKPIIPETIFEPYSDRYTYCHE